MIVEEPFHVTHVVLRLDVGGIERVVVSLVREGIRRGQRVSVICMEDPGALADEVTAAGAAVRCMGKTWGFKLGMIGAVRHALKELEPDIVHTHQIASLFYAGAAARLAGVPVVAHTEHGRNYDAKLRMRWLGRCAALTADKYFCVSKNIADDIAARRITRGRKIAVVPNGIDTSRFAKTETSSSLRQQLGIPDDARVIGTVANLREVKRQDLLIRGFARLNGTPGRMPHLLLVGDGPLRDALVELAIQLNVASRVHFVGAQTNPETFLRLMNVFALTSRTEGMPLAVLEAWAAALPVVGSRVGGLPEIIRDSENGLMFESGDEDGLAVQLEKLLSDPARATRMGLAGQEWVRKHFDVSVMAQTYHRHYAALLGTKPEQSFEEPRSERVSTCES